jgi:hypothetical protein
MRSTEIVGLASITALCAALCLSSSLETKVMPLYSNHLAFE